MKNQEEIKMIKMNNIILQHGNTDISIAQHKNTNEGNILCQEVAILPKNCNDKDSQWTIHKFNGTLDSLIDVLIEIKKELKDET